MIRIPLVFLTLIAGALALAQEVPTSFKATDVVPGIYMLEGDGGFAGGNITLVTGEERIVLIDDGLEPLAPALIQAATDIAGRPIDFVIDTHVHLDHTGGNAALSDAGATVLAHDNIRSRMLADPEQYGTGKLPLVTFSDSVTLHLNKQEAFVFHVAHAHTDGDAVIHFRDANVIHAGDIMFNYLFPFVDLDNGGSYAGYLAAQRRIASLANDDTIIIPGHGPLANKKDLQVAIDMLVDAETRVKALLDKGMSADDIVTANPLAVYHERWNWGFITTERMTRSLVRSLTTTSAN